MLSKHREGWYGIALLKCQGYDTKIEGTQPEVTERYISNCWLKFPQNIFLNRVK